MVVVEARTITRVADSATGPLVVVAVGKNPTYAPVLLADVGPAEMMHEPFVVAFNEALTVSNQVPAVSEILRPVAANVVVTATGDDNEAWT